MMKKIRMITLLFVIALLFGSSAVLADITYPPKLLAPKGDITDRSPAYKWKPVAGAIQYRLQIIKDGSPIYTYLIGSPACCATKCTYTPPGKLTYHEHKWRMQARVDGDWTDYSSKKVFTVRRQPAGFHSQFTSDWNGWKKYKGSWSIDSESLYTMGIADVGVSMGYKKDYYNFTYQAKMKQTGCSDCSSGLILRGVPKPLDSEGKWKDGYLFAYSNDGHYAVMKFVDNAIVTIVNWPATTGINNEGWNTLKVVANGKNFKFYINNDLKWKGKDTSFNYGKPAVFTHYESSSTSSIKYWVDWAKLTPIN